MTAAVSAMLRVMPNRKVSQERVARLRGTSFCKRNEMRASSREQQSPRLVRVIEIKVAIGSRGFGQQVSTGAIISRNLTSIRRSPLAIGECLAL